MQLVEADYYLELEVSIFCKLIKTFCGQLANWYKSGRVRGNGEAEKADKLRQKRSLLPEVRLTRQNQEW